MINKKYIPMNVNQLNLIKENLLLHSPFIILNVRDKFQTWICLFSKNKMNVFYSEN